METESQYARAAAAMVYTQRKINNAAENAEERKAEEQTVGSDEQPFAFTLEFPPTAAQIHVHWYERRKSPTRLEDAWLMQ